MPTMMMLDAVKYAATLTPIPEPSRDGLPHVVKRHTLIFTTLYSDAVLADTATTWSVHTWRAFRTWPS